MTGPSAMGSENGTPSSITSAPAATSACMTGTVASSEGSPAVTNGISALRWADLSFRSRNRYGSWSRKRLEPSPSGEGWGEDGVRGEAIATERITIPIPAFPLKGKGKSSQLETLARGNRMHVLVAATGEVAQHQRVLGHFARQFDRLGHGVAGFQRRQDAFGARQGMERGQRFVVGDAHVLRASRFAEEGMLGTHAGIIQAGRTEWVSMICPSSSQIT